jgi:hypothetical protein
MTMTHGAAPDVAGVKTVRGQDGEPAYATIQNPVGAYFALMQVAAGRAEAERLDR